MLISEIAYLEPNVDQYKEKIKHLLADSNPMKKMWGQLLSSGKINKELGRAADNYLGLMSKCGLRGNCSLTRFRSANMLNLELEKRTGKKVAKPGRNGITQDEYDQYGIHIEHSIPLNVKLKLLESKFNSKMIPDYETFKSMYTKLSVGVAMTRKEEHSCLKQSGYASNHPGISGDLSSVNIDSIQPFARYNDTLTIYDMTTGKPVSHSITLSQI